MKRQWGFNFITTKKGLDRASADFGMIMTAYNLRRLMNMVGIPTLLMVLQEMCQHILEIWLSLYANTFDLSYALYQTKNQMEKPYDRLERRFLTQKNRLVVGF